MFEAVFQCKLMLRARSCNWISGEEAFTKIKLHHEKLLRVGSGYNSMNILVYTGTFSKDFFSQGAVI